MMIRILDLIAGISGLILSSPVLVLIYICGLFDTGSPIFSQERVGYQKKPFRLLKFRTMKIGTVSVATHFADINQVTTFGSFLRRSKLDELPQLWNVIRGDMSLVGPRPCLFGQTELIEERDRRNVFSVRPGITGLAQIRGIDMSTPSLLAETERQMLDSFSLGKYLLYIFLTFSRRALQDRIRQG